jgi:hypothetical protein
MGKIIWLASYPKSGNTWFRAFLANFLRQSDEPVEINNLGGGPIAGSRKRLNNQLRQRLLTWSGHVSSWVDEPDLRVHVMRYEEMKRNPFETFRAAVRFAGLPDDAARGYPLKAGQEIPMEACSNDARSSGPQEKKLLAEALGERSNK